MFLGLGLPLTAQAPAGGETNLISNGTFDSGTGWTLGGSATISGGKLRMGSGAADTATQAVTFTAGNFYKITWTIDSISTGNVAVLLGGTSTPARSAMGTYTDYIAAGSSDGNVVFTSGGSTSDAVIDNAILVEPVEIGLGAELVTDGGFDDAGSWTVSGAGASITGGKAVVNGTAGTKSFTRTSNDTLTAGMPLRATVTISSYVAGTARAYAGGNTGNLPQSNGTHTINFVTQATDQLVGLVTVSSANLEMDDVSIKEVLFA